MYLIVVGAGAIGTPLIEMATQSEHEVVVIETDEQRADRAASQFDCLVLQADATNKETLEDAGAGNADAVISTTDEDAVNIMVMLLASELGIDNRVSVVHNPEHMTLFRQIGVNTMENPQRLIAEYLFRAVQRPAINDFMDLAGDAEIFEVTVEQDSDLDGKTLNQAARDGLLPEDVLVIAVERDGETIPPRGSTTIQAEDLVTVFSQRGVEDDIVALFDHID